MLAHLLSTTYKTYKKPKAITNEIGLPTCIQLSTCLKGKVGLGDGAGSLGDIHLLSELAHPKTAIVTLVGEAHLYFSRQISEIAKGKDASTRTVWHLVPCSLAPADSIVEDYLPTDKKVVRLGRRQGWKLQTLIERKLV